MNEPTLNDLKSWLGIEFTNTTDDALLSDILSASMKHCEDWCRVSFTGEREKTEYLNGNGKQLIRLNAKPINSITSLKINDELIQPSFYLLRGTGFLVVQTWEFYKGKQNVEVTYMEGYSTVPQPVKRAVIELSGLRYREKDRIGHQSKSLQGETVSFFTGDMPESVKEALKPYRRLF